MMEKDEKKKQNQGQYQNQKHENMTNKQAPIFD